MAEPYPALRPNRGGMLDVGDGHRIRWEESGNPAGKPALVLHGGPGGAPWPGGRRWFDPTRYRIVQFDQRMAGRSTPSASEPMRPLTANTTHHLIADIERLRASLGIERWLVCGASWGVTLGLAYAERHPSRVTEMVLVSVTMTRRADIRWLYHDAGRFFPAEWRRFRDGAAAAGSIDPADLVSAYHRLLHEHPDPVVRERAARDWCEWEDAVVSLEEGWTPNPRYADAAFRMAFARIVTHYFHHAAWLDEGELLDNAGRLAGIPAVLVHGRFDISGPPDVAWLLADAWQGASLHLVRTGHLGGEEMLAPVIAATDAFAAHGQAGTTGRSEDAGTVRRG
ncbi:MAG TPA: prolyl aminopeptidase [Candidatus Limnocylindria bacterium]|nr:prolyl aminopeptidase [Candidatus Limnocylindria bacterium]